MRLIMISLALAAGLVFVTGCKKDSGELPDAAKPAGTKSAFSGQKAGGGMAMPVGAAPEGSGFKSGAPTVGKAGGG